MNTIKPIGYIETGMFEHSFVLPDQYSCKFTQFPVYSQRQVDELLSEINNLKRCNERDIEMLNAWAERAKSAERIIQMKGTE